MDSSYIVLIKNKAKVFHNNIEWMDQIFFWKCHYSFLESALTAQLFWGKDATGEDVTVNSTSMFQYYPTNHKTWSRKNIQYPCISVYRFRFELWYSTTWNTSHLKRSWVSVAYSGTSLHHSTCETVSNTCIATPMELKQYHFLSIPLISYCFRPL